LRHFCSLFNSAYQYHAHLLYKSICENDNIDGLQFYFFCFDQASIDYFERLNLKNVKIISLEALENYLPQLKEVKPGRSIAEYFFTSTPAVCKYVMEKFAVDEIVYLDADLFFYQSPEILFSEIGDSSISIIPHRFNLINYYKNIFGYYNVGWISFKNDAEGIACLNRWYGENIEWCFDKLTLKRYCDQKYLDTWTKDFKSVCIIKNKGCNVAPWNVGNYKIRLKKETLYIDDAPLVFYHFASLKFLDGSYYTTISSYFTFVTREIVDLIYRPYIGRLYKLGFVPKIHARLNKKFVIKKMRGIIRRFFKDTVTVTNQEPGHSVTPQGEKILMKEMK
jgi:hypothetical protein